MPEIRRSFWARLLEILREFLTAFGADAVARQVFYKDVVGPMAKEKLKSNEELRHELHAWIAAGELFEKDPVSSATLMRRASLRQERRQRTYGAGVPYKYGDENYFWTQLTNLWKFLGEKGECALRLAEFQRLARLSDEEFDRELPSFDDNKVQQWFMRVTSEVAEALETSSRAHLDFARELDRIVNDRIDRDGYRRY